MVYPSEVVCDWCSEYFIPAVHNQEYCCLQCRTEAMAAKAEEPTWAERLEEGARMLSDEYGFD